MAAIKELTKKVEEGHAKLNEKLNATNGKLDAIQAEVSGLTERVGNLEGKAEMTERGVEMSADVALACLEVLASVQRKQIDQEARARRNNLRISCIPETYGVDSMSSWLDGFLKEQLGIEETFDLKIQRAHRTLAPKPKPTEHPRAVIVLFLEHKTKEMVRQMAWKKKPKIGETKIFFDDDYPAAIAHKRMEYNPVKKALATRKISFSTPGTMMKVHFGEDEGGTKTYTSAREATEDLRTKGFEVDDPKPPRAGRRADGDGSSIEEKVKKLMDWQEEGGWLDANQHGSAQQKAERRRRLRDHRWNLIDSPGF